MKRIHYLILSIIGGSLVYILLFSQWHDTRLGVSMISNAMVLIGGLWCGWLIWRDRAMHRQITLRVSILKRIGPVCLGMAGFVVIVLLVCEAPVRDYLVHSSWEASAGYAEYVWVIVFYAGLSIPLQEIIFRGYFLLVLQTITDRPWIAIVGSSTLYALAHYHYGWDFLVVTFAFGLVLGWMMWRTRNIALPIYLHLGVGIGAVVFNILTTVWYPR